ncbi:MAG: cytochrome c3 family protein [Granulosicoccus sp.]
MYSKATGTEPVRRLEKQSATSDQSGFLSTTWLLWILGTLVTSVTFGLMFGGVIDQSHFMPGPLSPGHHQLQDACGTCHTSEFGGDEMLQNACSQCHADERDDDIDSHPISKFEDPRNAARLEKIDATFCVTCHVEHQPAITLKDGLTQPKDICVHCHTDIDEERPSHADMGFETCASSGCHNYHDNRALYTDFLIRHREAEDHLGNPFVTGRDFAELVHEIMEYPHEQYPVEALDITSMDSPETVEASAEIHAQWQDTAHAAAGVNCSSCHQPLNEAGESTAWVDKPGIDGCQSCHGIEVRHFTEGKHGMRLAQNLQPMTPAMARLPMQADAAHEELTCNTCHGAHDFNVVTAAVEACESCHADEHTVAYRESQHYALWLAETQGDAPSGSGVSCATCHMPRESKDINDWMERVVVNHNQNDTLSPNSKMIRPVCLSCHGLEFSINALADESLIDNNFNAYPSVHVDSVDLARAQHEEHERKRAQRKAQSD